MTNGLFITGDDLLIDDANVADALYPEWLSSLLDATLAIDAAHSLINGFNAALPMTADGAATYGASYAQVSYANGINTQQVIAGDVTIAMIATLEAAANATLCGSYSADVGAGANQNKGDALFFAPATPALRMYMGGTNASVSTAGFTAARYRMMVGRIAGTIPKIDVWNDAGTPAKVSAVGGSAARNASGQTYRLGGRNSAWPGSTKAQRLVIFNSAFLDAEVDALHTLWAAEYGTTLGSPL